MVPSLVGKVPPRSDVVLYGLRKRFSQRRIGATLDCYIISYGPRSTGRPERRVDASKNEPGRRLLPRA